ncbi:MAG: four-carbon acid sugar kinase family protein [Actinomycetota bacterium]|nr:four-carbon acid sugar kinase family protein [Actinomycetota bacterium]
MRDWLVAADDRTGAFEVAALFAAVVGPVMVATDATVEGSLVVDLGSRGVDADSAAARAGGIDATPARWTAHKIDSTLRGNWAVELEARRLATGRRVVVLAGWPEMGRACLGGVVHVHGAPIGSVHDHLAHGTLVPHAAALREWLHGRDEVALCDVPDHAAMYALAAVLADAPDVLVAGPAGPLGAAFAARGAGAHRPRAVATVRSPMLVVCGSANAVSREQVARLAAVAPHLEILAAPETEGSLHPHVARELAAHARTRAAELQPATIVVIGGDTAAAFLGDAPRLVGGSVAPGMPWSLDEYGGGPLVITKAGGFGDADTLVRLLSRVGG